MPDQRKSGYLSDKIHQATRMVSAQAHCSTIAALAMMRERLARGNRENNVCGVHSSGESGTKVSASTT
jgi:hypothetical protein